MRRAPDPFRRAATLAALMVLAAGAPALSQVVPPLAGPRSPAAAPPPLAVLPSTPAPIPPVNRSAQLGELPLTPAFTPLPEGGWRLTGSAGQGAAQGRDAQAVGRLARALAERTQGRVTVLARVAGPADDPSMARRASMANAIAMKRMLEAAGLPGTRIDLRPLGRTAEAENSLDIIPPLPSRNRQAAPP
ncbi:hypothetical protein [Roseomonas sp. BN140053]|uniref:hypothetical protein n=1 Tax=Roseomonas sp. BN140053 TaxID=3391898 RepID=UPI0039E97E0F